jgi:cation transport ATPase
MALSQPTATVSLALAIGVTVVAGVLALRQRHERRHREAELSEADARHFARQDLRRALVGVVMVLLALCVAVGSRIEPKLAGRTNAWFLAIWLAVFLQLFVLLWLALLDWIATWLYARRHRRALARERLQFLREEQRRRAYRGNGRGTPQDPLNGASTP